MKIEEKIEKYLNEGKFIDDFAVIYPTEDRTIDGYKVLMDAVDFILKTYKTVTSSPVKKGKNDVTIAYTGKSSILKRQKEKYFQLIWEKTGYPKDKNIPEYSLTLKFSNTSGGYEIMGKKQLKKVLDEKGVV